MSATTKTDREKMNPFICDMVTAVRESGLKETLAGFDEFVFAAIIFRESGFTWARGYKPLGDPKGYGDWTPRKGKMPPDGNGWGRGLCQIDYAMWKDWLNANHWWEPLVSFRKACAILRDTRGYLKSLVCTSSLQPVVT